MANEMNYSPYKYKGNGTTVNFPFGWNFYEDTEVIVSIEDSSGVSNILTLNEDYTITADSVGGEVVCSVAPTSDEYIIISRNTSNLQKTRYSTSTGFQGSDVEKSFDKVSCNLQEMAYNIETFKTSFTETVNGEIENFENEVDGKIEQVSDAVTKLNKLDDTLAQCESSANSASESATAAGVAKDGAETKYNEIQNIETSFTTTVSTANASLTQYADSLKNELRDYGAYHPPLFHFFWADHILNRPDMLRADTFSWQSGSVYSAMYNMLEEYYESTDSVDIKKENFTTVGNPTIENEILTGGSGKYLLTNEIPDLATADSWEIQTVYTHSATNTANKTIWGNAGSVDYLTPCLIVHPTAIRLFLSSNGTSWDINETGDSNITPVAGTTYYLKAGFDGTQYYIDYNTDGGETYTRAWTLASTTKVHCSAQICFLNLARVSTTYWSDGTIDLSKTLIKIGDNIWWTPYSVVGKRASNGWFILNETQEEYLLNLYQTVGVSWFYLFDKTNTRFKLPRTKYGFVGFRGDVGGFVPQEVLLPDITGEFKVNDAGTVGSFYYIGQVSGANANGGSEDNKVGFKASLSSPVYGGDGTNTKIQPKATQMYLYFYAGNYTLTAIQQTAGLNAELFNNKVDLNALNLSAQGRSFVGGLGMPSPKTIDITLGARFAEYTAPANGYFILCKRSTAIGQFANAKYISPLATDIFMETNSAASGNICYVFAPCAKGQTISIDYNAGGEVVMFKFVYAEGDNNE